MNFSLIDTQSGLDRMTEDLFREKIIAFDIECASNLHHYINRVCLFQFAARGNVFVVDVLKDLDLTHIKRILEDGAIEIVMHDTDFDLRSLDRDYGWRPHNLFDTLQAARLCGHKEFGLSALLEKHFGTKGSKKFQRADWTIRPLPRDMLEYAAADVIQLEELRDLLAKQLEKLGRMAWARARFDQCEEKRFQPDERPLFARVKKAREACNGRELAIVNEFSLTRDVIARELDLPHFMVMGDATLIDLAKARPRTIPEIVNRRGLHPACKGKYAGLLVESVSKGLKAPELSWPRFKHGERQHDYSPSLFNALKEWRTKYAQELTLDPDLILSMNSLRQLAGGKDVDEVLSAEPVLTWRGEDIKFSLTEVLSKFLLQKHKHHT
ncbi:MAG: hypothetical protein COV46_01310 [Deltaproteobacteria bacterium CG11_big_fil_rev_8_21_14_0_20_49_13]|nr:MAG: hypothetical protein COV46_01310 [Deltaproteobacteria bacterium CG11_big_fil_rev_8_21_14_0_20_49_13]